MKIATQRPSGTDMSLMKLHFCVLMNGYATGERDRYHVRKSVSQHGMENVAKTAFQAC